MDKETKLSKLVENRFWFILGFQSVAILLSLTLAFLLRFDFSLPPVFRQVLLELLIPVLLIKLFFFWRTGLFQGWWRYVSMADLITLTKANLFASIAVLFYAVFIYRMENIPRSVLVVDGILCFMSLG